MTKANKMANVHMTMEVDILRDEIMDKLTPLDVINFLVATGMKFERKDVVKYTNIFKRWLLSKLSEGLTFTILSPDLRLIAQPNVLSLANRYSSSWTPMPAILIMTKEGKFIPHTDGVLSGLVIGEMPFKTFAGFQSRMISIISPCVYTFMNSYTVDVKLPNFSQYTNKRVRTDEVLDEVFYEMGPTSKRIGTDKFLKSCKYAHASTTVNAIMSTEALVNPAALPFGYVFTIDTSGKYEYVIADTNRSADRQLDSRGLQ
ncbi:hypothetical protein LTR17_027556 [Elasticomyces elasticus]|nr:hypothetical protein LTR17_027556 [Elasticomyces elasticus]